MSLRHRVVCSEAGFVEFHLGALALVEGLYDIQPGDSLEGETVRVSVDGDEGLSFGELIVRGERLGVEEGGDRWVLTDGQWWREREDWDVCFMGIR